MFKNLQKNQYQYVVSYAEQITQNKVASHAGVINNKLEHDVQTKHLKGMHPSLGHNRIYAP